MLLTGPEQKFSSCDEELGFEEKDGEGFVNEPDDYAVELVEEDDLVDGWIDEE